MDSGKKVDGLFVDGHASKDFLKGTSSAWETLAKTIWETLRIWDSGKIGGRIRPEALKIKGRVKVVSLLVAFQTNGDGQVLLLIIIVTIITITNQWTVHGVLLPFFCVVKVVMD